MRTNQTEVEIGVSQPTVSRAVCALTTIAARAPAKFVPAAEDVDLDSTVLIDRTLLPCWSLAERAGRWSGKHQTTGVNVQVARDLDGRIVVWASDPLPGSTHDLTTLTASGLLDGQEPFHHIADKGYQGSGMITPAKNPIGRDLTESDKYLNRQINSL